MPLLAVTGIALAGCSTPAEPEITFYSHGTSIEVAPAHFCDPGGDACSPPRPDAVGKLRVPDRAPLQISVPKEVASTPWQVAFIYRGIHGEELDSRSPVFSPNQQFSYTLRVPPDGARLEHVEVQQFSALLTEGAEGGVDFGIGGSWVLDAR
jgi:hypothetical protein